MKVFNYLIYLSNLALISDCTIVIEELNCEEKHSLTWLWNLRNNNRCLSITTSLVIPKCFFDQILNTKFVVGMISPKRMLNRNIHNFTSRSNCDNFLIFSKDLTYINELFQQKGSEKRFAPFSQIYLAVPDMEFDQGGIEYVNENALNVFLMENALSHMENGIFSFKSMVNVLTKKRFLFTSLRSDAAKYFGNYKDHPFLSSKSSDKIFRVSLFNCPPYVVYVTGSNKFDGLEYRILNEITYPWTIQHTKCDISDTIKDPWSTVLRNLNNNTSDLAMCSIWLNVKSSTFYDVTNHVDYQCGTFLVPKPKLVNPAAYIYMSLSRSVWSAFLLSFVVVSMILTLIARTGKRSLKKSWKDDNYIILTRSFMDSLNVATVHGIEKFPKQDSMKTLFTSWIVLSLIIGVAYSTGYTALLTHPISTKPVDDLIQFLENSMLWSVGIGAPTVLASTLNASGVAKLVQLSQRTFDQKSINGIYGENNALFVKIITNRYITDISNRTDPTYSLRIMKSCFLNYYSSVALKKHSCYTKYFNEKIRSYREFGFTYHWALNIKGTNNNYMKPYFRNRDKTTEGPTKLTVVTLTGAFYLLSVGLSLASVTFLSECLFAAYYSNKNRLKVMSMCKCI